MHGWPGSVFEFIEIIDQLAIQKIMVVTRRGCIRCNCSLPGFGFSGTSKTNGPRKIAEILNKLMTLI